MGNIEKQEPSFYKSLRLNSESLMITVKEKSPWTEGEIQIYHSPRKWDDSQFMIHLKDLKSLNKYIAMLQQFRDEYEPELKALTARNSKKKGDR